MSSQGQHIHMLRQRARRPVVKYSRPEFRADIQFEIDEPIPYSLTDYALDLLNGDDDADSYGQSSAA